MSTLFSKIIAGQIPAHKVAENAQCYAFLDIAPLQRGHTLVVPKEEVDQFFEVEDELLSTMVVFAKKVAAKIKRVFPCNRIGMTVMGLEIPHAHIHLIPIDSERDMHFDAPRLKLEKAELESIAQQLRAA